MKLKFEVTVTIDRADKECQSLKEFEREDGKAMKGYVKENIMNAVHRGSWQYNAIVTSSKVKSLPVS